MAKVTFVQLVFQSDYVLRECLTAIKPYGKIVVCEGPVEYYWKQGQLTSTDRTHDILRELVGCENVVSGQWKEKDDMMNALNHLIPDDTTHVWMVDSDEIWKGEDVEAILAQLDGWDSVAFHPYSFYGGFERYMSGFEQTFSWQRIQRWYPEARWKTHRPPTVCDRDGTPFAQRRHWSADATFAARLSFYHYSYVFPTQIKSKIGYYHARNPKGTIDRYYERVYLPWVTGDWAAKARIEDKYDGVHDWLPQTRGPCRTRLFVGLHPQPIMDHLPKLQRRLRDELAKR